MKPLREGSSSLVRSLAWVLVIVVLYFDTLMLSLGSLASDLLAAWHDVVSYLVPIGLAGTLAAVLFHRASNNLERHFWGTLGVTFSSLFAAETYFTWYVINVNIDGPSPSNPVSLLYIVALMSFASVVVRLTKPSMASPWRHIRLLFDIAAGAWASVPIVYVVWTFPLLGDLPGAGVPGAVVAAFYPVVGTLIVASTVVVLGSRAASRWMPWEWMVGAALWVFSAALFLFPVWRLATLTTPGPPPTWLASLLGAGFVFFVLAQCYRLTLHEEENRGPSDHRMLPEVTPRWLVRLYPVAVSCALVWVGWLALRSGRSEWGSPLVFFAVVLSIILTARSCLAALEGAAYHRGALTDPQTGARVRSLFDTRITDSIVIADDTESSVSLIIMDVATSERFDAVLGHSAGETRLREALETVSQQMGKAEGPYLLESYRFAFILEDTTASQALAAASCAWRALTTGSAASQPLDVAFGIAAHSTSTGDAAGLLSAAHSAVDSARALDAEPIAVFDRQEAPSDETERAHRARMRAFRDAVRGLAQAVDARDPYTKDHSANVSELATALAQVLGMPDAEVQVVALAALVHDVGKVGVSDDILLAGDDLGAEEIRCLRTHPELGERILAPARVDAVLPLVRHHHERWDGGGYPDGLRGGAIPEGARLLAICDAFECMTSPRSWRLALNTEQALSEIERSSGAAFDPTIARAFVRMVRRLGTQEPPAATAKIASIGATQSP